MTPAGATAAGSPEKALITAPEFKPGARMDAPGIVGMGKAAELARIRLADDSAKISALRDRLEAALLQNVPSIRINGYSSRRVGNTTNITFPGASGESLVIALDLHGIACSTGAACSSGAIEPSHVLLALGLSDDNARSSLRFSLGRNTTSAEIDRALATIPAVVEKLRALSPRYTAAAPVAVGEGD